MRWTESTIPLTISVSRPKTAGETGRPKPKRLSVTLGTFENVAPTVMEKIGDSNIAAPGEENIRQYTLSDYFTDRNLSDGDVLAYTASSSNEAVVAVSVAEDILTLTPKAKGSANITVTATDLAGASAEPEVPSVGNQRTCTGPGRIRPDRNGEPRGRRTRILAFGGVWSNGGCNGL